MNFMVVKSPSPYNGIIGRSGVKKLQAVPSTAHRMLKLPVEGGVITLKSSRMVLLECAVVSGPEGNLSATKEAVEKRIKCNLDIFARKLVDMTSIPRHIAKHHLNVWEGYSPVRQKKRGQAADRNQAIQEEVGKLVKAGIMKEVHYHDWLSNLVMVKKHDDSWRMCVDFKDLNKACPKDGYPLPEIDWKVEFLCGFPFKCFLDTYKGYHQIQMAKEDEEKTAFITSQRIFCYTKMPFGLRNSVVTYQRLVDKAFHKQIGRNLEVYVVDLVIKIRTKDEIVRDIEETFKTLREINMKQGRRCFKSPIPKVLKRCTKVERKARKLEQTAEAEEAFKQMKQLIAELPMLVALMEKEDLIVYLAAAKETILADFIVERPKEDFPDTLMEVEEAFPKPWILFTDGSSCIDGSGAGLILTNPKEMEFTYALRFRFDATNNKAEYKALIAGLRIAEQMGVKNLQANVDSRLVAYQVNRTYVAKEADMIRYIEKVRALASSFKAFSIRQVPRSENKKADALSKIASTSFAHLSKQVLVEELKEKSIGEVEILAVVEEEGDTWMTLIFEYLTGLEVMSPAGVRDMTRDRLSAHRYAECFTMIRWTSDLPKSTFLRRSYLNYFTKWIKAKLIATITGNQIKKSVWDNIVCRFGLPEEIISDNGKQFWDNPFKDWCEKLCIRQHFASVKHPQTNGLVERANRSLGEGIKARLDLKNKNWMEELSHVLWGHRTMIKSSNKDTPFSLTYGTKAVIPAEIVMPTLRTAEVDLTQNNESLKINLDLLEEKREQTAIR
ncbi:reverse transcriptase domain-containing protein [Tanacetum coccineum]